MTKQTEIQHDLRREFHNLLGLIKIIRNEDHIKDAEIREMLNECLKREGNVSNLLDELNQFFESST